MDQLSPTFGRPAAQFSPLGAVTAAQADVSRHTSGLGPSIQMDLDTTLECERPLIAIVEDDHPTAEMVCDLLTMSGYRTLQINRGETAYAAIRAAQPQLIVLDLWLEHHDAGSMAVGLLSIDPATAHIPIVLCSAQVATLRARDDQLLQRVAGVVEKPFGIEALLGVIQTTLARTSYRMGTTS